MRATRNVTFACVALSSLFTLACGSEEKGQPNPDPDPASSGQPAEDKTQKTEQSSFAVASAAELPKCDSSRAGHLAYVKDEKKLYHCEGSWQVAEMAPQSQKLIAEHIFCNNGIMDTHAFEHTVVKYVDGSVFVACQIKNYKSQLSVSSSNIYSPMQNGSDSWGCQLTADLNNTTSGWISFDKHSDNASRARIRDLDNPYNDTSYVLQCTRRTF